jgi:hypothetical protein
MLTANVNASNIISTASSLKTIALSVMKPITKTEGMVRLMVANTDPNKMLTERYNWFAIAARVAPSDSGERLNTATRKPLRAAGACNTRIP